MNHDNLNNFLDCWFQQEASDSNAVPVENARRAVQKLKELGMNHKYNEVDDAYHTGYNKWDQILDWLRTIIGEKKEKKKITDC